MNKLKTFLWVFVAFLALFAVGSFAVQAMPIKTVPSEKCKIEVISEYCTYSFTDSTENVATEFVVGETYTLNATSDYGYTLESVSFNNEIVSLPYTFVASVNDFVTISTEPITIIPNVISSLSDYSFTNINDEVVTEFTFGETYTITVTPTYCAEFEKIVFNNEIITENPYTFTLDSTSVSLEIWSNYSELPYSVSAENCSYYFMDVVGNYPTELKLGTIYTFYANPVDGYTITSATLNGMEISLPYQFSCNSIGEIYNFVINTQEQFNNVIINLNYDSAYCSPYITDVMGGTPTTFLPNTYYILNVNPAYGWQADYIYTNTGEQLFDNATFYTGSATEIAINIQLSQATIDKYSLVEANNCSFVIVDGETYGYVDTLTFGREYILRATANSGYTISQVEYMGQIYDLAHRFTFNNLTEKFYLNAEPIQAYTPYVSIDNHSYEFKDMSNNTVAELKVGETYKLIVRNNYGYYYSTLYLNGSVLNYISWDFVNNNENFYEKAYIFTATEQTNIYTEVYIAYLYPNVICDNGSLSFQDTETFEYTYELNPFKTYIVTYSPETNYVLTSIKHNGAEISLPYTFTPASPCEFEITTEYLEPVDNSVSITLNYDSSLCSVTIVDSLGTEVTEFKQNADYTIFVTPSYGYMISSIVWQPGIDLTNTRTFNTGTNETIPIFITCVQKTVHHSSIIEATNCSYKFFDSNNNYVTNLVFGESYTLTATADDGYTISSVEYIGQTYSLPYTFVLNNLELRFTLDASRNEFADFTINYSGLPSGLTANAKILGMEATDSVIMFDIVSESFSSSVTSNVDLNSLSLDLNYFRVEVVVPYGYEVTSLIVNSVNYEVYESTTNCYLTYANNLINLSNISYTIDVIFSELTSSTAYVIASGCSESSACSVYFYLKNDAEIDIDNNFFNASVCVDAYNGVNGPVDFSDYLQHNKFMKIRLVLPYLTNLVSLNATLNNNSISFNCVDSSLGIYESTEVFEFPCKRYELNLYFVLSMATTSIVSSSSNCIYEFTDTDGDVVTSLIVGNEYILNVSPIDGFGSLVCTYVGQEITNPYTFTLTDTSGRFVFSASE